MLRCLWLSSLGDREEGTQEWKVWWAGSLAGRGSRSALTLGKGWV